ncbi:hypothetical protein, partial [Bacillus cereus]|uniref:hypothetical protein n=1 Tax=Bacillus cereus TaxID=1396 RepID=UPI000995CEAA
TLQNSYLEPYVILFSSNIELSKNMILTAPQIKNYSYYYFFENVINMIPFKFQILEQPIDKKSY